MRISSKLFLTGLLRKYSQLDEMFEVSLTLFSRGVAQLVARVVWDHEVARSNRVTPTIFGPLAQLVRAPVS